ncbi:hypothetical protein [Bacillus cereus]|uniref:hypothetical protein n=1 Tax=Bacillus cereus TaxID=1396 RepID=UPI002B24DB23|nr:hypothetical protein [Bacillus cereus]MEB2616588.1 hypothetical protein [Bacillus cereus]
MPKVARNEFFYFVARASGLFASLVVLPVCAFLLLRVIGEIDDMQRTLIDIRINGAASASTMSDIKGKITDQENRLRQLERRP